MKVIVNNYRETKNVTCSHCKSILEVELKDLKRDIEQASFFECPLCHHDNYVDASAWFNGVS